MLLDHKGRIICEGADDGQGAVEGLSVGEGVGVLESECVAAASAAAATPVATTRVPAPPAHKDLLGAIADLEADSYPADEKASEDRLRQRAAVAPEYFRVLWLVEDTGAEGGRRTCTCVGFVCATSRDRERIDEDAMAKHDEGGQSLCIHSVVTAKGWRRRGLAKYMVQTFLLQHGGRHKRCLLLTKERNRSLYESAAFKLIGPWPYTHGEDKWLEMEYTF